MEIILDDKLTPEKVGYKIHMLIRAGNLKEAAEIAYQSFGFKRAFKIYLNAGKLEEAKKFARAEGLINEFSYFCREQRYKVTISKGPNGPPIYSKIPEKRIKRDLETEIDI